MDFQYLENMKKLTEKYNILSIVSDFNLTQKNKILFYLLYLMYEKKFNRKINAGVLAQIIVSSSRIGLSTLLNNLSNEKLIFDEEKNMLRLGDVFQVTVDRCPTFMQFEGEFECIKITFTNTRENCLEHFMLCSNENLLWTEHGVLSNTALFKGVHSRPYQIRSYEMRNFDSFGIEMERQINTEVELGIPSAPNFSGTTDGMLRFANIINQVNISRDPSYFKVAKIKMVQRNSFSGPYQVSTVEQSSFKNGIPMRYVKESYGLCPYGQSLDVNQEFDSYEKAVKECELYDYLDIDDVAESRGFYQTISELDFIPHMNDEIRKRIEMAKVNYKRFVEKHK